MDFMFVVGAPDDNTGVLNVDENGAVTITLTGSCNLGPYLADLPGQSHTFCVDGQSSTQSYRLSYWPDVIINEISDADTHDNALRLCAALCQQQGCAVINSPDAVRQTGRDRIYQRLHHVAGLNIPRTIRITPRSASDLRGSIATHELQFPLLLRPAGQHSGTNLELLLTETDIDPAAYRYALDGRDYYLTEFVDYKSADGLYRKWRLAVVGGEPLLRHLIIADSWAIHSSSRSYMIDKPALQAEEKSALDRFADELAPALAPAIREVTDTIGLDYYGIDCTIEGDGKILVFEINASMNILLNNAPSFPNKWEAPIELIRQKVSKLIIDRAGRTSARLV